MNRPRSSRQHYDVFRRNYEPGTLDDAAAEQGNTPATPARAARRREYLNDICAGSGRSAPPSP